MSTEPKARGALKKGNPLVDAAPAMNHVRSLYAKGMLVSSMEAQCGLAETPLRHLLNGYRFSRGKRMPVVRCAQSTLDAVLAIEFEPESGWLPGEFSPKRLRGLRESRSLSRKSLANLTGLDESTIYYWETGRSAPRPGGKLERVLNVLGVELESVCSPQEKPVEESLDAYIYTAAGGDDYTNPYPCYVCKKEFRSRNELATHPHK